MRQERHSSMAPPRGEQAKMKCSKRILPIAVALLTAVIASPTFAQYAAPQQAEEKKPGWWLPGEFTGGVALTNNYIFRGITQSDDDAAIQGNLNYALETGFAGTSVYGGVWGSNVDFNDGDGAHVELDWSFGLSGEILDSGVKYTMGGIYYSYPSRSEYNYWEVAPTLAYAPLEWLTVQGGLNYSPDYFNGSGNGWYPNGGVKVGIPIPENWFTLTLEGYTGHQWIEHNDRFGADDYQDWKLGLSVGIKMLTLSAYYTDTNLSKGDCGGTGNCGPRAVLALGATF
jgi:uncharacterized protein (TIGR02001 family)